MKNRSGYAAGLCDSLGCVCVYWIVAATMIMADRGWSLGLFWLLGWTALCGLGYGLLLRRERSFSFLMLLGVGASLCALGLFVLLCGKMTFLYVFTLAVGAGMASGLPLYYCVKSPSLHSHLSCLDVLVLAFLWLLLVQEGREISRANDVLVALVLVSEIASAVSLRMGNDPVRSRKALLLALLCAAGLGLVVLLLVALFSRSAGATGSVLGGVGSLFSALGQLLTAAAAAFASLFHPRGGDVELAPADITTVDITAAGTETTGSGVSASPIAAVVFGVLLLAALVFLAMRLRRHRVSLDGVSAAEDSGERVSSLRSGVKSRWQAFWERLQFRLTAFVRRDSAPGLLVWLERRARRQKKDRREGESIRQFLRRMAPRGELDTLADDLEQHFYAHRPYTLTAARCRTLRQTIQNQ